MSSPIHDGSEQPILRFLRLGVVFWLASFLLFTGNSSSQEDFLDEISNWLGEWESSYLAGNQQVHELLTIEWTHNKRWIKFGITGESGSLKYSETIFLTADPELNVLGFYINDSGYRGMSVIKGKVEDEHRLIFDLKNELWMGTVSWERKNGLLHRIVTGKTKGTDRKESVKSTFTKKD